MKLSTKSPSLAMSLFLTGLVLPGLGQWYLGKKIRGGVLMSFTLLTFAGGFFRYMVVLFALVNKRGTGRPPNLNPFPLMAETWSLDHRVLWTFIVALILIWILAILDVFWIHKQAKEPRF